MDVHNAQKKDQALSGYTDTYKSWFSNSQCHTKQKRVQQNQVGDSDEPETSALADINTITTGEHLRHQQNNLYFNCHKKGHLSQNYPKPRDKQAGCKTKCQAFHRIRKVTKQDNHSLADESEDAGDPDTENNDESLCIKTIHAGYDGSDFQGGPLSQ